MNLHERIAAARRQLVAAGLAAVPRQSTPTCSPATCSAGIGPGCSRATASRAGRIRRALRALVARRARASRWRSSPAAASSGAATSRSRATCWSRGPKPSSSSKKRCGSCPPPSIIDVGTGSGCLAVALAAERPDGRVFATDISHEALLVAAATPATGRRSVHFVQCDLPRAAADPGAISSCPIRRTFLPAMAPRCPRHGGTTNPPRRSSAASDGLSVIDRLLARVTPACPGGRLHC